MGTWGQGGYHDVVKPGSEPTSADYKIHSLSTQGTYDLRISKCYYCIMMIVPSVYVFFRSVESSNWGNAKNGHISTMVVTQEEC